MQSNFHSQVIVSYGFVYTITCPWNNVNAGLGNHPWCRSIDGDRFYYSGVIMGAMASQITSLMIVYSTVYSDADQRKHQSSASLAFMWGIHRWPVNSPHKWPVTRKMFPFDDSIMDISLYSLSWNLEDARSVFRFFQSLRNLAGLSATLLPKYGHISI